MASPPLKNVDMFSVTTHKTLYKLCQNNNLREVKILNEVKMSDGL